MGGLFRAPKPVETEQPSEPQKQKTVAEVQAQANAAAETATKDARAAALARAQRGIAGTIATGARGILAPLPASATRKNLLGE
jgi:hypothetical protein